MDEFTDGLSLFLVSILVFVVVILLLFYYFIILGGSVNRKLHSVYGLQLHYCANI